MFVSDLRHFLDMPDDAPTPARRLGLQLAAIVRAASARPTGSGAVSAIGCTRRPGRRPCEGFIMVFRRTNGEIAWSCDECGDEGVISGWEGSPADASGLELAEYIASEANSETNRRRIRLLDEACTAIEAALVGE